MRILRLGIIVAIGMAFLGIDVGESVRTGTISDASAHAKKRHRKHRRHRKHGRKHHSAPPATEM